MSIPGVDSRSGEKQTNRQTNTIDGICWTNDKLEYAI